MTRRGQEGFTFAEVMIGSAILGLSCAVFLLAVRHSLRLIERADRELMAVRKAETLLARGASSYQGARLVRQPPSEDRPAGIILYEVRPEEGPVWYLEVLGR